MISKPVWTKCSHDPRRTLPLSPAVGRTRVALRAGASMVCTNPGPGGVSTTCAARRMGRGDPRHFAVFRATIAASSCTRWGLGYSTRTYGNAEVYGDRAFYAGQLADTLERGSDKDDTRQLFDDPRCQWHHWSRGYRSNRCRQFGRCSTRPNPVGSTNRNTTWLSRHGRRRVMRAVDFHRLRVFADPAHGIADQRTGTFMTGRQVRRRRDHPRMWRRGRLCWRGEAALLAAVG